MLCAAPNVGAGPRSLQASLERELSEGTATSATSHVPTSNAAQ